MTARDIADRLLHDLASVDPDAAAALGEEPESIMPALAPEDFDARRAAYVQASQALQNAGDDVSDRVLAAALEERVNAEVALDDSGFTRSLLAPLATPVHEIRAVFDKLPREVAADWVRITTHLEQVPAALQSYARTLGESAANGRVVSRRQIVGAAEQCEHWIGSDDFYRRLAASGPDSGTLRVAAERASEATAEFARYLRSDLLSLGREREGVGRSMYQLTARAFLGDDVDLDEMYAFGWDELSRLTDEMTSVAHSLGASSIERAAAELDADPTRRIDTLDKLLTWLQNRVNDAVDAVDGVHFDLPPTARRPECRMSDASEGVMYYAQPDPNLTRPGRIVWAPSAISHTWREVTTVHHEGVPGHHLQIVTALAENGLHPWQRSMAHVHGYAEGWAHYSERLCDELGLLNDPGERLGMLFGQRWRAARIVIDMGLHLDLPLPSNNGITTANRWTPELGVAVLRAASGAQAHAARFEVERYFGWPGQALAFRVGAQLWRDIRDIAEKRPDFDLRSFHMAALRLGPMGLGPLRRAMLDD